jgi:GT2 family glycosyltransferase
MRLSVVIVNWNGRDWIGRCLASIPEAALDSDTEVIVVDNHSTDSSVSYIRETFPTVRVIESSENLGFGRGAQAGVESAEGAFVTVANADVVFGPGSIDRLARALEERPRAAWVGPRIVGPDGRVQSQALRLAGAFEPLRWIPRFAWLATPRSARRHDRPVRCERLYGACMVFRAAMLDEIGGMPTGSFLGGEEQRLAGRFREKGYEVWYEPSVTVFHELGTSRRARWPSDAGIVEMVAGANAAMGETLSYPRFVGYQCVLTFFSFLWLCKGSVRGSGRGRQWLAIMKMSLHEVKRGPSRAS